MPVFNERPKGNLKKTGGGENYIGFYIKENQEYCQGQVKSPSPKDEFKKRLGLALFFPRDQQTKHSFGGIGVRALP